MTDTPDLPPHAFGKLDGSPDALFYTAPRFVAHIDARAVGAVTALYRAMLPPGGNVLDLMSSWISHLPEEARFGQVVGLGMNADELAANPRLHRFVVQDLNADPALPFGDGSFDAATICVSVQYLQQPVAVLGEVNRVLRPGGLLAITVSDRCFPTKAVAIWGALSPDDRCRLVAAYLTRAGFAAVEARQLLARDGAGDPLWSVTGRVPKTRAADRERVSPRS